MEQNKIFSLWGNKDQDTVENQTENIENQVKFNINITSKPLIFKDLCDVEDCVDWMHDQKLKSYEQFLEAVKIGNSICRFTKEENIEMLNKLLSENENVIQYMTPYIEEAFEHVLTLRFDEIIQYYLERGLPLDNDQFNDCLIILTKTARLFPKQPPTETLQLLLKYGADPNQIEKERGKWRTPLHLACKYGIYKFVQILLESKDIEVNSVDGLKKTPLNYADEQKSQSKEHQKIFDLLKSKGGNLDWKY